jgi:hypothetical protein
LLLIDALFQIYGGFDSPTTSFLKLCESILTSAAKFDSEELTVLISKLENFALSEDVEIVASCCARPPL